MFVCFTCIHIFNGDCELCWKMSFWDKALRRREDGKKRRRTLKVILLVHLLPPQRLDPALLKIEMPPGSQLCVWVCVCAHVCLKQVTFAAERADDVNKTCNSCQSGSVSKMHIYILLHLLTGSSSMLFLLFLFCSPRISSSNSVIVIMLHSCYFVHIYDTVIHATFLDFFFIQ